MEEARTKEHITSRDFPGSDLRRDPLCAVLPWHSQAIASFGGSHPLHELLLGAPANGGEGTQQQSNRLRLLARILRLGRRVGRHGTATNPVEAFHRNSA